MTVAGWVDSHCHLQLPEGEPDDLVARALGAGVSRMVCVGIDLESSYRALDLAERHPQVLATVGLHPHDASKIGAEWGLLEPLASAERCVAIGETGLDFHYLHSAADEQEAAFRTHIRLAQRLEKALVVHTRDAWDDTFRVLRDEGAPGRTIFHCFTGGVDEAERVLELGAYVSFSGIVSFPNAGDVRDAARIVPADRLLIETDAPYLAPVPHRGKPNEPALVGVVGAALAAARGAEPEAIAALTSENAGRVYGFDGV